VESLRVLPVPPAEAVLPLAAPPAARNNGMMENWNTGTMEIKNRRARINDLFFL
jgi:hypothetical protein